MKQYTQLFPVYVTVPAGASQGVTLNGNIVVDIGSNTQQQIVQVPNTQSWGIADIYDSYTSSSAPATDGSASIVKNTNWTMYYTDPLSALGVSNPSRPSLPYELGFNPGDRLQIKLLTLEAASTTTTYTDTLYAKIKIVDYSL